MFLTIWLSTPNSQQEVPNSQNPLNNLDYRRIVMVTSLLVNIGT